MPRTAHAVKLYCQDFAARLIDFTANSMFMGSQVSFVESLESEPDAESSVFPNVPIVVSQCFTVHYLAGFALNRPASLRMGGEKIISSKFAYMVIGQWVS